MIEGGEIGRRIAVGATPLTVGRDPSRDLVLYDSNVSRLHLEVCVKDGHVTVVDRDSTNGTLVDGHRVSTAVLNDGSHLQVGSHILRVERRSKREVQRLEEVARDLDKASQYVRSLLPDPLTHGPVLTDWYFQPSLQLGGDVFGYEYLDADTFVIYLIDVSGHGAGAAMHSVSLLNVLRQRAMATTDVRQPAQVLSALNAMFQMDRHDGMLFTMWYGVYDLARRLLRFGSAGHHPGYLVPADRRMPIPLRTPGPMLGAMPAAGFSAGEVTVEPGSSLYLFSDGVFEVMTADERQWRLADFLPLLTEPPQAGTRESLRLHRAVRNIARPGPFDDDFSLVVVTFP
jgi:serine phosphatase RsbU (regulator of sigma subunit)